MTQSISLNMVGSPPNASGATFLSVHLDGYCSVNGSDDVACALIGLAYDSGVALSSVEAAFADEVILALPNLGLQKGVVSRVFGGGFEFHFAQGAYTKVWPYLNWLKSAAARPTRDNRQEQRLVPIRKLVGLECPGEPPSMARIIDLSPSGAAFTTTKTLKIGARVVVGRRAGKVIRLFEGGVAVQFDETIPAHGFNVMINLDAD